MARIKRYENAIRSVISKDFDQYSKNECFLMDYAHDVDRAEEQLVEAHERMVELFNSDIERVSTGHSSQNPMGYSCADDAVKQAIVLEERARAFRYMVRLALGSDAENALNSALDLVRKTQLETQREAKLAATGQVQE